MDDKRRFDQGYAPPNATFLIAHNLLQEYFWEDALESFAALSKRLGYPIQLEKIPEAEMLRVVDGFYSPKVEKIDGDHIVLMHGGLAEGGNGVIAAREIGKKTGARFLIPGDTGGIAEIERLLQQETGISPTKQFSGIDNSQLSDFFFAHGDFERYFTELAAMRKR